MSKVLSSDASIAKKDLMKQLLLRGARIVAGCSALMVSAVAQLKLRQRPCSERLLFNVWCGVAVSKVSQNIL